MEPRQRGDWRKGRKRHRSVFFNPNSLKVRGRHGLILKQMRDELSEKIIKKFTIKDETMSCFA